MPRHAPHPRRRGGRAASALVAAAVASVCLAAALAVVAPAAQAAAAPRCTVPQLRGALKNLQAGAGNRFGTLVLRNVSRRSCSLFGYPGALLRSRSGRAIPTDVVRDRSVRPVTVVLRANGGRAVSQWRWGAIPGRGEPTRGRCEPRPARIEVTPPNATRQLVLPWRSGPVCQHGRIEVRPMRAP
jgi:hypothetical protein